jgi:hypothetical protein
MKRTSTIFSLMMTVCLIGGANAIAQNRNHSRDEDRDPHHSGPQARTNDRRNDDRNSPDKKGHDSKSDYGNKSDHHHWKDHHRHDRNDRRDYERRNVRHVYHYHDRYCGHQSVVVHHHSRPRYIYYRDYDVYYDRTNSVYISYSGRGWTSSTALPVVLHRVNLRNTKRFEVDYYHDDFTRYLETRRPSYGRECEDW